MKRPLRYTFTWLAALSFLAACCASCNNKSKGGAVPNDRCKNVVCANGGTCDSATGSCICLDGYSGSHCETIARDKFIGDWTVVEAGSMTAHRQYFLTITPGSAITDVLIQNFYNYFLTPIKGRVSGDSLVIPQQTLQGKIFLGAGIISSSTTYGQYGLITMSYAVIDSATVLVNDFGVYSSDTSKPSIWHK